MPINPQPEKPQKDCVHCGSRDWAIKHDDDRMAMCRECSKHLGYSTTWGWV